MVNMKQDKKEAEDGVACCAPECNDMPLYPYGLELCLNDESLKKLGITELPAVGAVFTLHARVEVVSTRAEKQQDGAEVGMNLQITDMELGAADKPNPATVLYSA